MSKEKSYSVVIVETLEKVVETTAVSEDAAISKVALEYRDSIHVLDASHHTDTTFKIIRNEEHTK